MSIRSGSALAVTAILAAAMLAMPAADSRAEAASAAQDDCAGLQDNPALLDCALKQADAVDQELDAAYGSVLGALGAADREVGAGADRAGTLREAQQAWVKFRDHSCDLAADALWGGAEANIENVSCSNQMTVERIAALKALAAPAVGASGASPSGAAAQGCGSRPTAAAVLSCATDQSKVVEQDLNAAYASLMDTLRKFDKGDPDWQSLGLTAPDSAGDLRAAERAWITFREQSCRLAADMPDVGGGTGRQAVHMLCMNRMAKERIEALKAIEQSFADT